MPLHGHGKYYNLFMENLSSLIFIEMSHFLQRRKHYFVIFSEFLK